LLEVRKTCRSQFGPEIDCLLGVAPLPNVGIFDRCAAEPLINPSRLSLARHRIYRRTLGLNAAAKREFPSHRLEAVLSNPACGTTTETERRTGVADAASVGAIRTTKDTLRCERSCKLLIGVVGQHLLRRDRNLAVGASPERDGFQTDCCIGAPKCS